MKKSIIAVVATHVTWSAMDFVIHGKLLMGIYESTSHLWRPHEETSMGYMMGITAALAILFVTFYKVSVSPKSTASGIRFGLLLGLVVGVGFGLGQYCWMPIPFKLAMGWFLANVAKFAVGGAIIGALVKE